MLSLEDADTLLRVTEKMHVRAWLGYWHTMPLWKGYRVKVSTRSDNVSTRALSA